MELLEHTELVAGGWAPLPNIVHKGLDFVYCTMSGGKRQENERRKGKKKK